MLGDDVLTRRAWGVGRAAVWGSPSRIFVMDCVKEDGEAPAPDGAINPEIIATSEETNTYEEGCLSIPEQYAEVTRPKLVTMRWLGLDGKNQ